MSAQDKMCRQKKTYRSQNEAIRGCIASSAKFGKAFRWYKCPICHRWHITSQVR